MRGGVSDDGSLSTITPPRTRPQSDSEFTVSEESSEGDHSGSESVEEEEEEEEEENEGGESDYDTERVTSHTSRTLVKQRETQMSRSRARTRSNPPAADYRPSETSQRRLPRRQEMSPEAYRLARKRPPSPKQSPSKRSRPSDGINFSPNRTRFGIFESGSESDNAASRREGRKRRAAQPPLSSPPTKTALEGMSLSARTLRQAARQAASQFVETSRKILRDAKTAARILRESTSKRRSSSHLEEEDGPSMGKKPSLEERETRTSTRIYETRRSERIASPRQSTDSGPSSARRGAAKRKLQNPGSPRDRRKRQQRTPSESDSDLEINDSHQTRSASWRQVRKDGGRLRKFTRNSAATSPQSSTRRSPRLSLLVPVSSASLPMLPGTGNASATPSQSPARNTRLNNSFPSAMGSSNPFQNVTLRPSPSKATPTGSIDSISHELGGGHQWPSPFSSLLTDSGRGEDPQVLTLSGGSVWARISARTSSNVSAQNLKPGHEQGHASPVPGPSGGSSTRMATRTSPEVAAADYPAHSTPRVPSLTLTGQFAQSGRFAFLLENVLQVTVVTNDITTSTTNAIVVTTDGHLHHRGPAAQSVAKSAGSGFAQACRDFLRRNPRGLQVCEVLDTPAGGRLPALISHILHVVVPQETDASSSTTASCGIQQRKMLLCTYINCLKHASEKLGLPSLGLPLIGADTCSADECIQVFFDSLLVYLAERTPDCPLHALQLLITHPALARFTAEVLESRLQALKTSSVDVAMAAVFKEYFNVPEFTRSNNNNASGGGGGGFSPLQVSGERSPSGKPAVKRRRL
ncbi:uncharacterized protein LOC143301987 [Babylonia areolata]|uniref:uncharacterized protein LOC143301987 n=1 Tax=Babylonia areolata TaxID=304850 RepID=UPI003FD090D7